MVHTTVDGSCLYTVSMESLDRYMEVTESIRSLSSKIYVVTS